MATYQNTDPNTGRKFSTGKGLGEYDDAATPKASVKVMLPYDIKTQTHSLIASKYSQAIADQYIWKFAIWKSYKQGEHSDNIFNAHTDGTGSFTST